jgi:hypothetical protein
MKKELIKLILSETISELEDKEKALVSVFERVRDIPYGTINSRNPEDVYRRNMGTCSGKHFLLRELYNALGVKIKDFICYHRYDQLPRNVDFPPELKTLLDENDGIPDYHNFIKAYVNNKWVILDATFDKSLKGCFIVNEWDGRSDTKVSVVPEKTWEVKNPLKFKVKMLEQLPLQIQESRGLFLKKFSEWLEILRD